MIDKREDMHRKAFLVCHCTGAESIPFRALRQAAEGIFGDVGCEINRFSILHHTESGKTQAHNCLYKQCEKFDEVRSGESRLLQFTSYSARAKHPQQAYMAFEFLPQRVSALVISLVWGPAGDETLFYQRGKHIAKRLGAVVRVNYAAADTLEADKDVELFVQGAATNHRSGFENGLAHNNQLSDRVDPRMPFLYAYTATEEGQERYFPQLLGEPFEAYIQDAQWKTACDQMIEAGKVMPLPGQGAAAGGIS